LFKQIQLAQNSPIKPFGVGFVIPTLKKIKDKVIITIQKKQPLPTHDNLINLVSDPYMLIQAYRSIRSKKGAMTEAQPPPEFVLNKLNEQQQKVAEH
jgi:hypothetical protein